MPAKLIFDTYISIEITNMNIMKRWIGFILHLAMIVVLTSFGTYTVMKKVDVEIPDSLKVTTDFEIPAPKDSIELSGEA